MPVFPPGITPYKICPPLTSNDMGEPSDCMLEDMRRVLNFIEDERQLTAQNLLRSVQDRIRTLEQKQQQSSEEAATAKNGGTGSRRFRILDDRRKSTSGFTKEQEEELNQVKTVIQSNEARLEKLEKRCRLFRKAQKNLKEEEEWTLASTMFGIDTFYRRESDGSLSLKLQGEVTDIPLFEQLCVLREVDLQYKWAPFCSSSFTVADLDKLDTIGWFLIGLSGFGLARDGCFRAIGCDNILEDGSILLAGKGIQDLPNIQSKSSSSSHGIQDDNDNAPSDQPASSEKCDGMEDNVETFLSNDPVIEKLPIPPRPTRRGADRMTIRTFDAIIRVTSPTSATTKIVANIDPNIRFLPQSLLEFIMKHMAGVLLAKLQSAAKKVVKNPISNEHARKMRHESGFYQKWLMAKFQTICDQRGWEMPRVNAFHLSEEDLRNERKQSAEFAALYEERRHQHHQQYINKGYPVVRSNTVPAQRDNDDGLPGTAPLTTGNTSASAQQRPRSSSMGEIGHADDNRDFLLNRNDHGDGGVAATSEHGHRRHRSMDDHGDSMSGLTSTSGRSWWRRDGVLGAGRNSNQLRNFLQKREEKRIARKEAEIESIRRMAEKRIQPRTRSESKERRLNELRGAKAERSAPSNDGSPPKPAVIATTNDGTNPVTSPTMTGANETPSPANKLRSSPRSNDAKSADDDLFSTSNRSALLSADDNTTTTAMDGSRRKSLSERITDRLQAHGRTKRFWVMSLVITLLVLMLNPELCEFIVTRQQRQQPTDGYRSLLPWTKHRWTQHAKTSITGDYGNDATYGIADLDSYAVEVLSRNKRNQEEEELIDSLLESDDIIESLLEAELRKELKQDERQQENNDTNESSASRWSAQMVDVLSTLSNGVLFLVRNGFGLLIYLGMCTILHFFACDIALVYAFNALDLGSKTGRQVKKYYSDHVRVVVAAISLGIYVLSVTKAVAQVLLSAIAWLIYNPDVSAACWQNWVVTPFWLPILHFFLGNETSLQHAVMGDKNMSEWVQSALTEMTDAIDEAMEESITTIVSATGGDGAAAARGWSVAAFGRFALSIWTSFSDSVDYLSSLTKTGRFFHRVWNLLLAGAKYLSDVTGSYNIWDLDSSIDSWQANAFETARVFFSYSTVPLLVFLILFNYSARSARLGTRSSAGIRGRGTASSSPSAKNDQDAHNQEKQKNQTPATTNDNNATNESQKNNSSSERASSAENLLSPRGDKASSPQRRRLPFNNLGGGSPQRRHRLSPFLSRDGENGSPQRKRWRRQSLSSHEQEGGGSPQRRMSRQRRSSFSGSSSSPANNSSSPQRRRNFRTSTSEPDPHQEDRQYRRRVRALKWTPHSDLGVLKENTAEFY